MGVTQKVLLFVFLLVAVCSSDRPRVIEARPLPTSPEQGYMKIIETLGIGCKCCDGEGGECKSEWNYSCSRPLQCLPWKLHQRNFGRFL